MRASENQTKFTSPSSSLHVQKTAFSFDKSSTKKNWTKINQQYPEINRK